MADDPRTPTLAPGGGEPADPDKIPRTLGAPRPSGSAAASPSPSPPAASDPELARYLAAVQLSALDLSDLEVPADAPSRWPTALVGTAALSCAGGALALPTTSFYQLTGVGEGLFYALVAAAGMLATTAGLMGHAAAQRGLRWWPPELAGDDFPPSDDARSNEAAAGEPAWLNLLRAAMQAAGRTVDAHPRATLGSLVSTFVALLVFALPHEAQWQGKTYSGAWFFTAIVAVVTGVLVGRFIMATAASAPVAAPPKPLEPPPPWVRWATLSLLVAGGAFATFGPGLSSQMGMANDFSFASVGLVVGIFGAIWIARRFDEWEVSLRREAEENRAAARDLQPFEGELED